MPRTVEQNDKIKQARKNDILAASLRLFSVFGYDKVSVDLITQTVDCSHGLFYHYFKNVENIYREVIISSDKFDFTPFGLDEIMDSNGYDGLRKIAEYFGNEDVCNEAFLCYAKIFLQEIDEGQPLSHLLNERWNIKNATEGLTILISKGQQAGHVIDGDPKVIAECVRKFLLTYVEDLLDLKRKDRKPVDSKILLGFISK